MTIFSTLSPQDFRKSEYQFRLVHTPGEESAVCRHFLCDPVQRTPLLGMTVLEGRGDRGSVSSLSNSPPSFFVLPSFTFAVSQVHTFKLPLSGFLSNLAHLPGEKSAPLFFPLMNGSPLPTDGLRVGGVTLKQRKATALSMRP